MSPKPPTEEAEFATLLEQGLHYGRKREFSAAAEVFRRATALYPDIADGHFNLGVAYRALDQNVDARQAFERAVQLRPNWPEAQFDLGNCYRDEQRTEEAIAAFQAALQTRPNYPKALNNLASLLRARGENSQAEELLRRALAIEPRHAAALFNLAELLRERSERRAAVELIVRAIRVRPRSAAYHLKLVELLRESRQFDEAFTVVDRAIESGVVTFDLLRHRAELHRRSKRFDLALADTQAMLAQDANSAVAYTLRGSVLMLQGEVQRAMEAYERAVALQPSLAQVHCALATAYVVLRRFEDAQRSLDAALFLKPDFVPAHVNRAQLLLSAGDFSAGWRENQWRLLGKERRFTPRAIAHWSGESLAGKSILLRTEQGLGDTFQFVRYAQVLQQRGAHVVIECQDAACGVVATSPGVAAVVRRGDPLEAIDFQFPLLSLPGMLATTLDSIPNTIPYLFAESARIDAWRKRFRPLGQMVVGIAWQGNREYQGDCFRSAPLQQFAPLATVPEVALVSLQKHEGLEQLHAGLGFTVHSFDEQDQDGPFLDTAAMIAACDLVVTTDSAVAHLAGAMGRPVWIALSYSAEWRWLQQGETSPWYPTMRLFRQRSFQDWGSVFAEMANDLADAMSRDGRDLLPITKALPELTRVPLAPAEIIDRFLILELKREHAVDPHTRQIVERELSTLRAAFDAYRRTSNHELVQLIEGLRGTNRVLWTAEDEIRQQERGADLGEAFVETARLILRTNDHRSELKRRINEQLHCSLTDVKIYLRDED